MVNQYYNCSGFDSVTEKLLISKVFNSTDVVQAATDAALDSDFVLLNLQASEIRCTQVINSDFLTAMNQVPWTGTNGMQQAIIDIAQLTDDVTSTVNTSAVALGAAASYTGTFESVIGYPSIIFSSISDKAAANHGLEVQWSNDGVLVDFIEYFQPIAILNTTIFYAFALAVPRKADYVRLKYTNNASDAQTSFRITLRKLSRPVSPIDPLQNIQWTSINVSASGDTEIIATPGALKKIKIIKLDLNNTVGTDNTVILKTGATALNGAGILLEAKKSKTIDFDPLKNPLALNANEAFKLNLSAATNISGFVQYFIGQ